MIQVIVILLLFLLPLIVLPFGISPFEVPKVILAQILITASVIYKLMTIKRLTPPKPIPVYLKIMAILVVVGLINLVISQDYSAFFGNIYRFQGLYGLIALMAFALITKNTSISNLPSFIFLLTPLFLFLSIFTYPLSNQRATGSAGEPNFLAASTLFFLPFCLYSKKLLVKIVGAVLTALTIFLTSSYSGLIGLLLELIFIILISIPKLSISKAILISLLLLALTLPLPFIQGGGWFENRAEIWQTAFSASFQSPIIGSGFGRIQPALHSASVKLNNNIQYQFIDSSHNLLLDFGLQSGLIGLIAIVLLAQLSLKNLGLKGKKPEIAALIGIIAALLFNPASIVSLVAFWYLLGQGFDKPNQLD